MALAEVVFHILPGVFIAHTRLHTELVEIADILAIACEDGVLVLIVGARGGIVDTLQVVIRLSLKSLLQNHSSKASILWHSAFCIVQL